MQHLPGKGQAEGSTWAAQVGVLRTGGLTPPFPQPATDAAGTGGDAPLTG